MLRIGERILESGDSGEKHTDCGRNGNKQEHRHCVFSVVCLVEMILSCRQVEVKSLDVFSGVVNSRINEAGDERGNAHCKLGDEGLAGEEHAVGANAVLVLLVVNAVCYHYRLENVYRAHSPGSREHHNSHQNDINHALHKVAAGYFIDDKDHCIGNCADYRIEVVKLLLAELCGHLRRGGSTDDHTAEKSDTHDEKLNDFYNLKLAVNNKIGKVVVEEVVYNERQTDDREKHDGTSENARDEEPSERIVGDRDFEVLLHGVLLFGLLNSLLDREAGKLEENSCEYRKDNGDYDIGHLVRMNKVKAFLLLEHGGESLSGESDEHADSAEVCDYTGERESLCSVVLIVGHKRSYTPERNIADGVAHTPENVGDCRPGDNQYMRTGRCVVGVCLVAECENGNDSYRDRDEHEVGLALTPLCSGVVNYRTHHRVIDSIPNAGDKEYYRDGHRRQKNNRLPVVLESACDDVVDDVLSCETY